MSKKKTDNPTYEVFRKVRREWGINPITRVVENKKHKKEKHNKREMERRMEEQARTRLLYLDVRHPKSKLTKT